MSDGAGPPTCRDLDRLLTAARALPYRCPGEAYSISRAVHLARLDSGYAPCRDCVHASEAGFVGAEAAITIAPALPPSAAELTVPQVKAATIASPVSASIVGPDRLWRNRGWRGIALDEITFTRVGEVAEHFAANLGRLLDRTALAIVIGHDVRPGSPALHSGLQAGLRRSGCTILDVGQVHEPLAWDVMSRRNADATLFVTGAGCDSDWNGLDFTISGPVPLPGTMARWLCDEWSPRAAVSLEPLRKLLSDRGTSRLDTPLDIGPATAGWLRSSRDFGGYEQHLRETFHALRPLGVVAGVIPGPQAQWLHTALERTACRLVEVPISMTPDSDADERGTGRVLEAFDEERAAGRRVDLAVLLHEDGFGISVRDDRRQRVPFALLNQLLRVPLRVSPWLESLNPVERGQVDAWSGFVWRRADEVPVCDALLTLGGLLGVLSERDAELSARLRELDQPSPSP